MAERRGTKALEAWCRRLTEGYPGVKIENMTTSWRDGLAFCAIIHHFRPDLIDFNSLNKQDVFYNNSLAFRIAERHLGIPALLDAEDMVEYTVPDRLSILTYLSQFYQVFGQTGSPKTTVQHTGSAPAMQTSAARLVAKRPAVAADRSIVSPVSTSPPTKMAIRASTGLTGSALGRREPCAKCGYPVFLAERLNVGTKLYHRTCFRCARCNNQLSLANCYETETDGQYCCETCPDEEESTNAKITYFDSLANAKSDGDSVCEIKNTVSFDNLKRQHLNQMRNRSLSDEEKTKGLEQFENDEYSANFENVLEVNNKSYQDDSLSSKARNHFLSTHLMNEDPNDLYDLKLDKNLIKNGNKIENDVPPLLPETKPPDIQILSATLDLSDRFSEQDESALFKEPQQEDHVNNVDLKSNLFDEIVNSTNISKNKVMFNQRETASDTKLDDEPTNLRGKNITKDTNRTSLVKSRMLMFEVGDKANSNSNILHSTDKDKINAVSKYFSNTKTVQYDSEPISDAKESDVLLQIDQNTNISSSNIISSTKDEFDSKQKLEFEIVDDKTEILSTEDTESSANDVIVISDCSEENLNLNITENNQNTSDNFISVIEPTGRKESTSDYEESHYVTVLSSSDDTNNESVALSNAHYKTVRSELSNSDSVINLDSSSASKEDSPLDNKESDIKSTKVKNPKISVLQNLLETESSVEIDSSILESSTDNSKVNTDYPENLNPFGDDDENEEHVVKPMKNNLQTLRPLNIEQMIEKEERRISTNPFGSSDEEDEENISKPPRPPPPVISDVASKKLLEVPRISLNPFWNDDEQSEEDACGKPIPMPRSRKNMETPEPKPRRSGLSNNSERYDSNSSLSSMNSSIGQTSGRKRKPAPPPPTMQVNSTSSLTPEDSKQSSPCTSRQHSPKQTPKHRKTRKAPLPPSSTPFDPGHIIEMNTYSPIYDQLLEKDISFTETKSNSSPTNSLSANYLEKEKNSKDEKNRNRQSQSVASPVQSDNDSISLSQYNPTDKSTHGKWKRKKGPAPARPIPQRRQIRPLPLADLKRELDMIEMQQQGLEKQGVKLEQIIREKCEIPGVSDETPLSAEVEELVLELFELVNEKNELFRRQVELMYLHRQQRLEEEYADLEYQIRCLMDRSESKKTDSDKAREEELINRLVEVVERRNEIVECLEMDRVREAAEDQSIKSHLTLIASKRDVEIQKQIGSSPLKLSKKEKKKIKKEKKLKETGKAIDIDKDIDESETSSNHNVTKEKKKIKWF